MKTHFTDTSSTPHPARHGGIGRKKRWALQVVVLGQGHSRLWNSGVSVTPYSSFLTWLGETQQHLSFLSFPFNFFLPHSSSPENLCFAPGWRTLASISSIFNAPVSRLVLTFPPSVVWCSTVIDLDKWDPCRGPVPQGTPCFAVSSLNFSKSSSGP